MDFESLQRELIDVLRNRVLRGEWTERGMARASGISQPHLHNVLKGERLFSIQMADQIMRALKISVLDLSARTISPADPGVVLVPLLIPAIGPRCFAFPEHQGQYFALTRGQFPEYSSLLAVHCGDDPEMFPIFHGGDVLLLDRSAAARDHPSAASCYLVHTQNAFVLRYVRPGGRRLLLATEATAGDPLQWDEADLAGHAIREIVQARVVWLNRSLDPAHPRH